MSSLKTIAPVESDILCEHCGYTLNGLPESGNCPECGEAIAISTFESSRQLPRWETDRARSPIRSFIHTSAQIIFRPRRFFRSMRTRDDARDSRRFAIIHWAIVALLIGIAAHIHIGYLSGLFVGMPIGNWVAWIFFALAIFLALDFTTWLAARLTAWEAAYRGFRLPLNTVRRGLYYHAPHYLPVALVVLATVLGYYYLRWVWSYRWGWSLADRMFFYYLAALSIEIVVGAFYLFYTYWIAMRNMMYANR